MKKLLIANRGEIACRIIRTLDRLGIASVAVYSEADAAARHVRMAGESVCLGPAPAAQSYLRAEAILEAAKRLGVDGIHPGYGFLSENSGFAAACAEAGITFIGPRPEHLADFGLKHVARDLARRAGVPMLPGSGLVPDAGAAAQEAAKIGYPVMLKSTAGGGGIGLQLCQDEADLRAKFATVQHLGAANFKESGVYVEKFVSVARHIEVQVFGLGDGRVVVFGERDCSAQRRNQKVVEETPAPRLDPETREALHSAARSLAASVNYASAGTVEFLYDAAERKFYFLEVNTRLQVEHGVTEEVFGVDLVEWMIRQAAGTLPDEWVTAPRHPQGHSIEVRIYAEDPAKNFQPSAGLLTEVVFPADVRIDGWVETGTEVPASYDPLLAKVIARGANREEAIARLDAALAATRLHGIETNLDYCRKILASPEFVGGTVSTGFLRTFQAPGNSIDVIDGGTQTTVQDFPGRIGYWAVGVPPSGPMDARSFQLANQAVGNAASATALEITLSGPTLRFRGDVTFALTGAAMPATLDGIEVPWWKPVTARAGQTLRIGRATGTGARAYLAIRGGFDVPVYLGSRATFTLGGFGGHGGRALRAGDVLRLASDFGGDPEAITDIPELTNHWTIGVLYGPHGAPDFFTPEDIEMIFGTDWEVHYNSSRTGVRLIGPKPKWARPDGGEAGLHPSNIHDNAYAIGALDFTGDMPILLGPDGPSLGGFVCPAVVVSSELWKLGQLKAGDRVRFRRVTVTAGESSVLDEAVVARQAATDSRPEVVYRGAGDDYLLIEYGPLVLDLNLRFRVQALYAAMVQAAIPGVIDLTPGIRSLQVHFDSRRLPLARLLRDVQAIDERLPDISEMVVPTRIVHLPLSWEDESTLEAIQKYMQSVRPDAPWCPSNIEFIRRINGLDSIEDVKRIVFDASYLVLGLGDVYLGAPVATPLDPRHRLVTTKYNPARTWTPENAVGIGGAYLCIYGMEGPGGYQFVGRTIQMWNRFRTTDVFEPGSPWLLRFFDQIRFYPVTHEELIQLRADFPYGKFTPKIEEGEFRLSEYQDFLRSIEPEATAFKERQQAAFDAERERWAAAGFEVRDEAPAPAASGSLECPPNGRFVDSPVAGNLWKVLVEAGQSVAEGDPLFIVESMKMEIAIPAPSAGTVHEVAIRQGQPVAAGQHLASLIEP
ncbi:MAG: urea carboxylase [Terrimicrobiaceae bacterium]|nr:urea carboxylase [Terrimicrobiaceae bacterium]